MLPPAPRMGPEELAAELAELYALSLVRDLPFPVMGDPHCEIWIEAGTRFTLHELLCELRSLSWFDAPALPLPAGSFSATRGSAEAEHRRGLRRNHDGQLTLRTLFRGVVARSGGPQPRLSAFHDADAHAANDPEPCAAPPADAPMSQWLDWVQRCSGAALVPPGQEAAFRPGLATPRDLVARVRESHPCRIYYNATLRLLARGAPLDPGLRAAGAAETLSAQAILSLMAETAELGFSAAMRMQGRADRLSRPGVSAARLTALVSGDAKGADDAAHRAAAEELSARAPQLLHWVDRLNRVQGRETRTGPVLLLPAMKEVASAHRADCAAQAVIAGALSTLLKALFDSRPHRRLRMVGAGCSGVDVAAEADRLAADIALARSVAGGWFQAENHRDLRLGEALACQVLRHRLERHGGALALGFTDFDGSEVSLSTHAANAGRVSASFRRDGRLAPWPMEALRGSGHLAVV
ncbi:MAG: bromoperoxidase [Rhodobacteraceae bacterium]|jgi:hypothetical protein|uniref:Bromoperoxidase n=1 Tax=Salipiger profundus TaxID=1229727 RepID=A0A1U7DC10_9RHOB|nr:MULTISPECIES: bromoperoxidase [Salipiger]APX25658.1 hypothetical protein Ga0080559_TMP4862 [Salipiger profundus]MAB06339.1 bromoperoxidase [Paracoccaceae bacterium]GGA04205.1 phosphoesterase [Salipiger profundus]SFD54509.1 hypothetical protein SAMN05444415_11246 [Salipiger profundus]